MGEGGLMAKVLALYMLASHMDADLYPDCSAFIQLHAWGLGEESSDGSLLILLSLAKVDYCILDMMKPQSKCVEHVTLKKPHQLIIILSSLSHRFNWPINHWQMY